MSKIKFNAAISKDIKAVYDEAMIDYNKSRDNINSVAPSSITKKVSTDIQEFFDVGQKQLDLLEKWIVGEI